MLGFMIAKAEKELNIAAVTTTRFWLPYYPFPLLQGKFVRL